MRPGKALVRSEEDAELWCQRGRTLEMTGRRGANANSRVRGTGRRNDPFRYWLAQMEERWKDDPWHETLERLEAEARRLREEHPEMG